MVGMLMVSQVIAFICTLPKWRNILKAATWMIPSPRGALQTQFHVFQTFNARSLQAHAGGLLYRESHQGSCLPVIPAGMHFVSNYRQWAINALKWNEKEGLFAKPLLFSLPITHKSLFKKWRDNSEIAQKLEDINPSGSVSLFSWQAAGILQAGSMSTSSVLPCATGAAAANPVF